MYPLKFEPVFMERVWGGRELARFGKKLPPEKRIGESWEISDRPEAQSIVANGPLKGKSLGELVAEHGEKFLGARAAGAEKFPLLVKLLDCRQRLSLQVHPPPAMAEKFDGEPKTEAWYILDAKPSAQLIVGLKKGVTGADFFRALEEKRLEPCLHSVPVAAGDVMFVPSGRMHAIDAGIVLLEVQQNSDTTFRVYDWNRVGLDGCPRELHVQQALACIDFQDIEPRKQLPVSFAHDGNAGWKLVSCPYFEMQKLTLANNWEDRVDEKSFVILAAVRGSVAILVGGQQEMPLALGEFVLLPANLGAFSIAPQSERPQVLKIFLPPT
jgi:mannose-6-phosphate isomerase